MCSTLSVSTHQYFFVGHHNHNGAVADFEQGHEMISDVEALSSSCVLVGYVYALASGLVPGSFCAVGLFTSVYNFPPPT